MQSPQGREMHPRGSTALASAICESRPGHLWWSSAWCFWVYSACLLLSHTEKGRFQLICGQDWFS